VWVRVCGRSVEVFHRDHRVAAHEDHGRWRTTLEEHLPEDRRELRHRGQVFWEARAARIGPETFALVRDVFAQNPALSQLRQAQAIVRHLERHPRLRAEATSHVVRRCGDRSYRTVKHVLATALDVDAHGANSVTGPQRHEVGSPVTGAVPGELCGLLGHVRAQPIEVDARAEHGAEDIVEPLRHLPCGRAQLV
jgi:hypothetical protein